MCWLTSQVSFRENHEDYPANLPVRLGAPLPRCQNRELTESYQNFLRHEMADVDCKNRSVSVLTARKMRRPNIDTDDF